VLLQLIWDGEPFLLGLFSLSFHPTLALLPGYPVCLTQLALFLTATNSKFSTRRRSFTSKSILEGRWSTILKVAVIPIEGWCLQYMLFSFKTLQSCRKVPRRF